MDFSGLTLSLGVNTGVDTSSIGVTVGRWKDDDFHGRPSLVIELTLKLDDIAEVLDVVLSRCPAPVNALVRRGDIEKLAMCEVIGKEPTPSVVRRIGPKLVPKAGSSRV